MIKNLQNQLNEAGKIKIGEKGKMITSAKGKEFRPPKKLDHFRLTTTEKDGEGDYIIDISLCSKLKKSDNCHVNKDGNFIGLPVRLVYNDIESNFPHRYVSYVSGKLTCHGDGEKAFSRISEFKKAITCPCQKLDDNKCKPTGTLTCVIDEAGLFGQAHTFRTTSINSIKGIVGGMELLLKATGGRIAWLPLMLTLNEKHTTTPQGINTTVYIVSLCFRGDIELLRGEVLKLIETDKRYLLDMGEAVDNAVPDIDSEDEQDFVNEFFPSEVEKKDSIEVSNITSPEEAQAGDKDYSPPPEKTESDDCPFDKATLSEEHKAQLITPDGEALKMYKRFLAEDTYDKAYSCAKRLKKGHLLWWLQDEQPRIKVNHRDLKPALLEIVSAYLVAKFKKIEESIDESDGEMIDENGNGGNSTPEPPIEFNPSWDDSGPVKPEQLRVIIQSKNTLEKMGKLKPENWTDHVNYFQDVNGGKVESAKKLTLNQAYTFIDMLDHSITKED